MVKVNSPTFWVAVAVAVAAATAALPSLRARAWGEAAEAALGSGAVALVAAALVATRRTPGGS